MQKENVEIGFQDYPDRVCKTCGVEFTPKREDQIFCSAKCCNKHHNRKRKNALAPVKDTVNQLLKSKQKEKIEPFKKTFSDLLALANDTEYPTQSANQISQIIRNRQIIKDLLGKKIEKINPMELKELGFDSNYFSGYNKAKNQAFLIDVGFQYLPNNQIQLFKLTWK